MVKTYDNQDLTTTMISFRVCSVMQPTVREIRISSEPENHKNYYLLVDWKGPSSGCGFQLTLTDGRAAWTGELTEAAADKEAEELEMPKETYIDHLLWVLNGRNPRVRFVFTLTPSPPASDSSVTLTYEKVQQDMSFRLGSVLLSAVPEPAVVVREILTRTLQKTRSAEDSIEGIREENSRLRREHQRIASKMKRYVCGKETLEAELYSRFVLVLNEKKAKIRSLQETIAKLQEARCTDKQKKDDSERHSQSPAKEEDDYGGSTDEDEVAGPAPPSSAPGVTPPFQESHSPSLLDDSLNDITDVAPCRKRRFRHLNPPEPTAKRPSPQASQRKRNLLKPASAVNTTTQHSDAANRSPTAEDLFEDF